MPGGVVAAVEHLGDLIDAPGGVAASRRGGPQRPS
jgi:hypothetical protein